MEVSWKTRQEVWDWEEGSELTTDQIQLAKDLYNEVERLTEIARAFRTVLKSVLS